MKEITKRRWGRFGWFCMSFVPMLGYMLLTVGVSTVLMTVISVTAIMGGTVDSAELTEYLMSWAMPVSIVFAVLGLILFGVWYYFGCKRKRLGLPRKEFTPRRIAAIILVAFGSQFMASYLIWLIQVAAPKVVENYSQLMEMSGLDEITWASILYAVILGPVVEELVFRGVTLFYAKKATKRFWLANIIQAVAFGIMHMNVVQGIYAFFLGLILGWVYEKFHSLYASILIHILFNFLGTCVLEPVDGLLGNSLPLVILWNGVGVAAFVAGMLLLWERRKPESEEL